MTNMFEALRKAESLLEKEEEILDEGMQNDSFYIFFVKDEYYIDEEDAINDPAIIVVGKNTGEVKRFPNLSGSINLHHMNYGEDEMKEFDISGRKVDKLFNL